MNLTKKAFTLIELLVVIAIIALLLSIVMPALRTAKEQTRVKVCASQIRQQCLALLMYAQENDETMPTMTWGGGECLWDVSYFTTDVVIASGAHRKVFRCPSNNIDTNENKYWRYWENVLGVDVDSTPEPTDIDKRQQYWRVISYCYLTETDSGRGDIWAPSDPGATKVPDVSREFIDQITQIRLPASHMEVVTDSVIEYPNTPDIWIIPDEYADWAMGTNHMGKRGDPREPTGGNIGFLDGHVTWRHFEDMYQRYKPPWQNVIFWW
jgi:prepilin-type N-terminal cleavage/methylation domain-containing protein/prepilin-type processing-associated H-X9-DG protein